MNTPEDVPPSYIHRYTWLLSRYPNFLAPFTHALREVAVRQLWLKPGNRVLDVGCGTGTSFSFLVQAVGTEGEVVGVEISPNMAASAKKRIEQEEWNNVRVAVGPAQTTPLPGTFDGLLLFAAHEVLTSPEALDHLLAHLKKRGANRGIWGQTVKLATRQTIEPAASSAHANLVASIERSSRYSSLAILGRSNWKAS
jgi:ubiquinone/menaquinone biosynthesis C-methylase UbiE